MKRAIVELREVVQKLVPLLTGKGLKVTQRGAQAYVQTDPKTRKPILVNIPNIPDEADEGFVRAVQGFIDHEVAHVLITDWNYYGGAPSEEELQRKDVQRFVNVHNIIEDTMIEREIVKIFPGSKKNIADLREHFIRKITTPAMQKATTDQQKLSYLMVPVMRALAGHEEFAEYMEDNGYWKLPVIEKLVNAISDKSKEMLRKAGTTEETYHIAKEIYSILYKDEENESDGQDQPDKEAGPGNGKAQRDHSKSDGEANEESKDDGNQSGAGAPEEGDDENEGEEAPGETDGDDAADEDDDGDGADGDPGGTDESDGDDDGSGDADEAGGDDEGNGADGGADEPDDEDDDGDGAGGESADPDDGDGSASDAGAGSSGEDEDGGKQDATSAQSGLNDDSHGGEDLSSPGEDQDLNGGGGVGNARGKSMFDYDEDILEGRDLGSEMETLISQKAVEAISHSDWSAFSREWDRIEPLQVPEKFPDKWVPDMEDEVRSMTGRMQKDIERIMASQSHVFNQPGHKKGRLHSPSLYRVLQDDPRVFTQRQEHRSKDTAVMLLADNSGSMNGPKMRAAMTATYALSATLERVKIAHEMLGFTTGEYGGSRNMREAIAEEARKVTVRYDRAVPLVMPIYKTFNERLNSTVKKRVAYAMNAQNGLRGNIDGECLQIAAERLAVRPEKRKVMIVLSDGQPAGGYKSGGHLKGVVRKLNEVGIETIGIGIMSDAVQHYYEKHVVLNKVDELPGQVMTEIKKILM